jgi:hypothetical protein
MNPIILYDNRFLDGELTATDTADGSHVDNIKDRNADTFWKAASAGTKYITEAPLAKDTLAQQEMRISPAAGYAGLYLPSTLDVTPYLGDRIVCLDSALKKHIGYLKSIESTKAVNMTYAASGSNGIMVADNNNIDMGTNNFTLIWKGALPDWTPSVDSMLIVKVKYSAPNYTGYALFVHTDGKLYLRTYPTSPSYNTYISTVAPTLIDGTNHSIVAVVTRESASTAGSVVFYVDGAKLGDSVAITAGAPPNLNNTDALYSSGYTTYRNAGIVNKAIVYNRALTAAEVTDLYNNGINFADQYGNQATAIYTSDFSAGVDSWGGTAGMVLTGNTDGINGSDDWLKVERTGAAGRMDISRSNSLTASKTAHVKLTIYNHPSSTIQYFNTVFGGSTRISTQVMAVPAGTEVTATLDFPISSVYSSTTLYIYPCTSGGALLSSLPTGTIYYVKNIITHQAGATLALEESGIGDTDWQDSSTNDLDAAYPASGSAVVLFNNIVSTPGGSTYNWESKEAGYNHEDAAGYAYKISESDACDTLFLFGHNLGTAGASVSVESSDDESTWTERLAVFSPTDDLAVMKLLTSFRAASKRLKINTTSIAPYIAEAILGNRLEMPYPPDTPMTAYEEGIESEMTLSRGGRPLGVVTSYFPIDIQHRFSNILRTWVTDNYVPFWEYAKYFNAFAYAPDLDTWPDDAFFCVISPDMKFRLPVSILLYVDYIDLIMRGYRS